MEITYLGHSSFKIKGKDISVITDPYDPETVGHKFSPAEAEIITVSHEHPDHNKTDLVTGVKKVINGPGEYEIGGVSIMGFSSFHDDKKGAERGNNTMYIIEIDQFRIAHLGDLGHTLTENEISELGDVDILMIPVGGVYTIDSQTAADLTKKIDPHVILPMHYKDERLKESFKDLQPVDEFVKDLGTPSETMPKLVAKDPGIWAEEQQHVFILGKI